MSDLQIFFAQFGIVTIIMLMIVCIDHYYKVRRWREDKLKCKLLRKVRKRYKIIYYRFGNDWCAQPHIVVEDHGIMAITLGYYIINDKLSYEEARIKAFSQLQGIIKSRHRHEFPKHTSMKILWP